MMSQANANTWTVRINTLAIVGSVLLTAGICIAFTSWVSRFARIMYVEDLMYADEVNHLGLSEEAFYAVCRLTPTDKASMVFAAVLGSLGLAAIIVARVRYCGAVGSGSGLPPAPALPRPKRGTPS